MSRYSETCEIIKKTTYRLMSLFDNHGEEVSAEEITASQLSGIYNILTDIALSLAVIADKEEENE